VKLYFIYMDGCGACEQAKPELAKFQRRRAGRGLEVERINLLQAKWVNPWQPTATPTYVLEVPGRRRVRFEGMLKAEQLEQFVDKAEHLMGLR